MCIGGGGGGDGGGGDGGSGIGSIQSIFTTIPGI